jgi:hypothetical protein
MPYSTHVTELRTERLRPFVAAAWAEAGSYSTDDLAYIVGHAGYRQGLRAEAAWKFADEAATEAEERAAADSKRSEQEAAELADYIARRSAVDAASREAEAACAAAGWSMTWRHGSSGGSMYYWLEGPADDDERVSLRISDHHAPCGAGWNDERQERHAEPDLNIVIRRGADGDYTHDLTPLVEMIGSK